MNLSPGNLPKLFVCQFPEGWILRVLSHDGVLHNRVAKVVNYCGDGEDAAKPFVQALLGLRGGLHGSRDEEGS